MVSGHKMIYLAATLASAAALLFATPQFAQAWDTAMVPVQQTSPEHVVAAVPGGVGTLLAAAAPVCLQCRCCSNSSPGNCRITSCCSTFNCDTGGKCNVVALRCDCNGCSAP